MSSKRKLPIFSAKTCILKALEKNSTVVLVGETGSGKTTQIPQFIYNEFLKSSKNKMCITQPRRVAASSLAKRVATEMNVSIGGLVGYTIRFDDCSSDKTQVHFMTDGMLLRAILQNPTLEGYSFICLDEAHERSVRTDVLFGIVKRIQKKRKETGNPLKVVVMSATLNADKFAAYFDGYVKVYLFNERSEILYVSGRQYPVEIYYAPEPLPDIIDSSLVTIFQIHLELPQGDVLVFLTGQEEIESLKSLIMDHATRLPEKSSELLVCPIYASLPSQQQQLVFAKAPPNTRKIILATNIAETSITIPGIRYVVDTGVAKMRGFNAKLGIESLEVLPISKAAARQRCGRAGRVQDGMCFRLYTEDSFFKDLDEESSPEILRCAVSDVILLLKAMRIENILEFEFLDSPPRDALKRALEELFILDALDKQGKITSIGMKMSTFPVDPKLARVLIAAIEIDDVESVVDIVSLLSVESLWINFSNDQEREEMLENRQSFYSPYGDHFTLLNAFHAYMNQKTNDERDIWCHQNGIHRRAIKQVLNVRKQLLSFCQKSDSFAFKRIDADKIRKCFLSGFFRQLAFLQPDNTYQTLHGRHTVSIHPSSVLMSKKAPCILYNEIVLTRKCYIRGVMLMEPSWLLEKNCVSIKPNN